MSFLEVGRQKDHEGNLIEGAANYQCAIEAAEAQNDVHTLAEALRHLGIARHRMSDVASARALVHRSREVSKAAGDGLLEAKALNTLAAFDLSDGLLDAARQTLGDALSAGGSDVQLRGRIEQNLGIIANIKGEVDLALRHYHRALDAFLALRDERGCAMVYSSLGYISASRRHWHEAERYYALSLEITTKLGDVQQRGQVLLNQAETQAARERYVAAQRDAEEALRIFDKLGVVKNKSEAYRVLGTIYRAVGRKTLAQARLETAISLAQTAHAPLAEAEASRELAQLFRDLGRNQDALRLLNAAHRLFGRLEARPDLIDITARVEALESAFMSIVLEWGQSIESADSYTHGHCERVAEYAVALGRRLGMDESALTALRLGAYLHDLGKVRVPHEILNKPDRLTPEELAIMKRHPLDGVELLADVEFPWDIIPIVRSHHERHDGQGYPDGLSGDAIPLSAQVICIVDVFDALTTTRSYRAALSFEEALAIIEKDRHWWRPDVFAAFMEDMRGPQEL